MKWNLAAGGMLALLLVLGNGCIPIMMAVMLPAMHGSGSHGGAEETRSTGSGSPAHQDESVAEGHSESGRQVLHSDSTQSTEEIQERYGSADPQAARDYPVSSEKER